MNRYILAIDQGTTGTTVILLNQQGEFAGKGYAEFKQHYPKPGWVEHDAEEIWQVTTKVLQQALQDAGISGDAIAGIGITNQRETTVIWDKVTGKPIHPAIVWQCRRTAPLCEQLQADGLQPLFRQRTGLVLDAYFSGTKIKWLLDEIPGARARAAAGQLLFGTIDTWLLWKLTGGKIHATDYSNAARTLIFNIHQKQWDAELLRLLDIPPQILPEVRSSSEIYGFTEKNHLFSKPIPISGIAGDQQAALFGQGCWAPGTVKNTYGTGCFIIMNTGEHAIESQNGLLATLACDARGKPCYALEGSVFMAGAVVQWLRDELKLIQHAAETEALATAVADSNGVFLVPAFVGLGAPYWEMNVRGALVGLTRGANRNHLVRAALEAIAFQTQDVIAAMLQDANLPIPELRVDGGACANNFLMQFQADLLNIPIDRPRIIETTALGAAFLAGLAVDFWNSPDALAHVRRSDRKFIPAMSAPRRQELTAGWKKAVKMLLTK
jgi:glycerol kinase